MGALVNQLVLKWENCSMMIIINGDLKSGFCVVRKRLVYKWSGFQMGSGPICREFSMIFKFNLAIVFRSVFDRIS